MISRAEMDELRAALDDVGYAESHNLGPRAVSEAWARLGALARPHAIDIAGIKDAWRSPDRVAEWELMDQMSMPLLERAMRNGAGL